MEDQGLPAFVLPMGAIQMLMAPIKDFSHGSHTVVLPFLPRHDHLNKKNVLSSSVSNSM